MNNYKPNLTIICEGQTEELFLEHLKSFFETNYNIEIKNAKSGDRILTEYKKKKKKNPERMVFVMYDMDKYESTEEVIELYNKEDILLKENEDLFFINPEFELVFELCKGQNKDDDFVRYIKNNYGVDEYKKEEKQIRKILRQINQEDIKELIKNLKKEKYDSTIMYSTNYDILLNDLYIFSFSS